MSPPAPPTHYPARPFEYTAHATLFTALVTAARQFGYTAPQWQDTQNKQYSYGDVLKLTLLLGRGLGRITAPQEHVGILLPNLIVTVGVLIATSAHQRIPCMLNYTAGIAGVQHACQVATIKTIVTSRAFIHKAELGDLITALAASFNIIYLEQVRRQLTARDLLWFMTFARWWPERAVPPPNPDAPAVLLFTSGSEGMPKGVVLSHRALLANVAQILASLPITPHDRVFNCLPIFHAFGLTAGTLLPLVSGARLMLYISPLHCKLIPEFIRESGSTILFGTSTFLLRYAQQGSRDCFHTLRYVVAGAEKLAEPVRTLWSQQFGIDILEGYGATETAPVLAVNLPIAQRHGSVGRLLPGIAAQIIPVPGIAPGGELHVRGVNLMSGYYRYERPALLEPPLSAAGHGWYNTGDIVTIDADGFICISGRLKRFAKVAGEMVSLEIVEQLARHVSTDAQHAAICVADVSRGEAIVLYTTDAALTRDQLISAARHLGYADIAVPRRITILEVLPLLGSGKIDYRALQALTVS